jgi:hypothetical protein
LDLLLDVGAALRRPSRSTDGGERHPINNVTVMAWNPRVVAEKCEVWLVRVNK